ncbi:hypothetical protein O6H91_10G061600 [Diphasiastrum complanatum]|nr:hypothetical protein O6H91_10G061600 [Diphasiastrum complanatum]
MGKKRTERDGELHLPTVPAFEEEADFPRGGASSLTPDEIQEARAEAEAEFENEMHKGKKKKSSFSRSKPINSIAESDELFADTKGKLLKSVSTLRFKGLSVGMKVWGAVAEVNKKDLVISLPNGLRGSVCAEEASDCVAENASKSRGKKQKLAKDPNHTGNADDVFSLKDVFFVGQLVACSVLNLESRPEKGQKKGSKRVELSLRLSYIYEGLVIDAVHEGLLMVACVSSVEDHGYLLSFGVPGITGFLLRRDYMDGAAASKLQKGQLVQGIVTAVDKARCRVSLKSNAESLASNVATDHEGLTLGLLLPGTLVNARVRSVLRNGLLLSFLTYFTGTVDIFHLDDPLTGSDWQSKYSENQRLRARILFVDFSSKSIGLTLKSHLINLKIAPSSVTIGNVFENATVRRVDATLGLLLELPAKPVPFAGYVHISNVSDEHVEKLEKNFKEGKKVRGRVIGYRLMDDLAIISLKQSVLEQLLLCHSDVKPGMRVSGTITAMAPFGAFVQLAAGLNALCPLAHMSEFQRATPSAKFQVGKRMKFRVLTCDIDSKKIAVTHKKTLLASKLPQITSYESAVVGLVSHGWIAKIEEYGVFVSFYNDVRGLVRERELGLDPLMKADTVFSVGQVVKCRVLKSDPDSRHLFLSFSMSERNVDDKSGKQLLSLLAPGSIVSAVLVKLEEKFIVLNVTLSGGSMQGTMSYEHLTDSPSHIEQLQSLLKPGYKFDRLIILENFNSKVVLSAKFSLLNAKFLPSDISQLHSQEVIPGYISNISDRGCFVRFLGRLTGHAGIGKVSDSFVNDLSKYFQKGQSVRAQILEIDEEKGKISLNLKHSVCFSTDASLLQGYFLEEEMIAELQALENGGTSAEWTDDLLIGSLIEGEVQEVKDYGVIINLKAHEDVVGFATHYQVDGPVQIGKQIRARILDVVKADGIVDLTLRLQLLRGVDMVTEKSNKRKPSPGKSSLKLYQKVNAVVELVKDEYLVLSLPNHDNMIAFAATRDYNQRALDPHQQYTPGQTISSVVYCLANKESAGRLLLLLEDSSRSGVVSSLKKVQKDVKFEPGSLVEGKVVSIEPLQLNMRIGKTVKGRVHVTEVLDAYEPGIPFSRFQFGQVLTAKVLTRLRSSKKRKRSTPLEVQLSLRPSEVSQTSSDIGTGRSVGILTFETITVGQVVTAYVQEVKDDWAWLLLSAHLRGRLSILHSSNDPIELEQFSKRFCIGEALQCRILSLDHKKGTLDLSLRNIPSKGTSRVSMPLTVDEEKTSETEKNLEEFKKGDIVAGRIVRTLPGIGGLRVQVAPHMFGQVHVTDIADIFEDNPTSSFKEGQFVRCKILEVCKGTNGNTLIDLSLRKSLGGHVNSPKTSVSQNRGQGAVNVAPCLENIEDLKPNMEVQGYIKSVSSKGCFVTLARHIDARILLSNLSDSYTEDPSEAFPVGKMVKGRIISVEPLSKRVEMSLKRSPLLSTNLQTINSFRVGQLVSGTIRQVETFGVFVAIEQSEVVGMCHISEASDSYMENLGLHYAVGQKVVAKILKIDLEKGRVSLGLKDSYCVNFTEKFKLQLSSQSLSVEESDEEILSESKYVITNAASDDCEGSNKDIFPFLLSNEKESPFELNFNEQEAFSSRAHEDSGLKSSVLPLDVMLEEELMEVGMHSEPEAEEHHSEIQKVDQSKKLSKRARLTLKKDREKAIQAAELKHLEGNQLPETVDDYEKLVHSSPNSSFIWIKYMAFLLSIADVDKARSVAERALEIINFREEAEKMNVWVALMNLENTYGNPPKEAVLNVFQRALQLCDPKKLHLALLGLYERTNQDDMSDELLKKMTRKFKASAKIWLRQLQNLLNRGMEDSVQKVFDTALLSLPRHKHIKFITHAAIMEFKSGSPERGRAMFEGVLRNYPKRTDLWSVYIDQEVRLGDQTVVRALFERVTCLDLPPKKMKFLFKKYLDYEKAHGDEGRIEHVKSKAMEFVETNMS